MPLVAFVIVLVASVLAATSGFGFGVISVPLLTLVLAPQLVVPTTRILGLCISALVVYEARRWLDVRSSGILIATSLLTMPVGVYLLATWDVRTLKVFIGFLAVLCGLLLLLGLRVNVRHEQAAAAPVGLISGVLGGSAGMGGLPIAIFYASQDVRKQTFRANLGLFFVVQVAASLPVYAVNSLLTGEVLRYALLLLPALAAGTLAGIRLARRVNQSAFRYLTIAMITAAGVLAIASGV